MSAGSRAHDRAGHGQKPDQRWPNAAGFRDALSDDSARSVALRDPVDPHPAASQPNAEPWTAQPPATHRAVRDVAPPGRYMPAAPPAPVVPPWLPPRQPADGSQPAIPPWMPNSWRDVRKQWRQYSKDQRRMMREQMREQIRDQRRARVDGVLMPRPAGPEVPVEYRIRSFRMHIARVGTSAAILAGVNFVTSPMVPWFLVPAAFMSLSVLRGRGTVGRGRWLRDVFGKDARLPASGVSGDVASGVRRAGHQSCSTACCCSSRATFSMARTGRRCCGPRRTRRRSSRESGSSRRPTAT